MGVITGRVGGMAGGLLVSLPQLVMHDWTNLPVNVLAGLLAGWMRRLATDKEAIWSFSPLFDLSIYRWIRRTIREVLHRLADIFLHSHSVARVPAASSDSAMFPLHTFALDASNWAVLLAIYAGHGNGVAIALKVLNNMRIEMKLEEQQRCCCRRAWTRCKARSIRTFCSIRSTRFLRWSAAIPIRARDDREALEYSAAPVGARAITSCTCVKSSNSSTTISISRSCDSVATS